MAEYHRSGVCNLLTRQENLSLYIRKLRPNYLFDKLQILSFYEKVI